MKKKYLFFYSFVLIVIGTYFMITMFVAQNDIIKEAHNYQTTSITDGPYILETTKKELDSGAFASFIVKDKKDGNVLFVCADLYRTMDLKSISWSATGYDIAVESGDTGTTVYQSKDKTWIKQ